MQNNANDILNPFHSFKLDPQSPLPLYFQLYESLSKRIHAGEIPNGFKLPSESRLAERLGVSRITIKRAFNELADSGLVSRKRGKGTLVTLNTALVVKGGVLEMTSNIAAIRHRTKAKLYNRSRDDIPESAFNALKLPMSASIEMTTHALLLNENAVTMSVTYAPSELIKNFSNEDIERESLITLMQEKGIRVSKADQVLTAIAATDYHAEVFSIPTGSPLMEIQCLMFDQTGTPCQFVKSYFLPEFYRYEMTLT